MTPEESVFEYHSRTAHRLSKYAAGPETLDWTEQPNPFREFSGSTRTALPLRAGNLRTLFGHIQQSGQVQPRPLSIESVGALLQLSLALTAWKESGPDRWSLRANPSSGNLHPTEAYLLCYGIDGVANGLHHYVSLDHALEHRCAIQYGHTARGRLWIGLSSIHWREAWKYGERAFRYCQLDIGHAIGALCYAAAALGWTLRVVHSYPQNDLAGLLGLDREGDFRGVEKEDAELLLEVISRPGRSGSPAAPLPGHGTWTGRATIIDPHPMYRWPIVDRVAAATQALSPCDSEKADQPLLPPPTAHSQLRAADVMLGRRSAQRFDPTFRMEREVIHRLLDSLLVRPAAPWDVWSFTARIHLLLFVHRVEGMEPGLYALVRRPEAEEQLRSALHEEFLWQRPESTPPHVPLYLLQKGDCRQLAKTLSCHQAIAADGSFSLAMLSEFETIVSPDPWRYRQLHWEAGLVGHVLYLEAEASGLRGTGIGCYFDDSVHEAIGLRDRRFASLYHFTVGRPITEERISTLPAYPERNS